VLNFRDGITWVDEIKHSCALALSQKVYLAARAVGASRKLLVADRDQRYPRKTMLRS